jgi:hypothetical protein
MVHARKMINITGSLKFVIWYSHFFSGAVLLVRVLVKNSSITNGELLLHERHAIGASNARSSLAYPPHEQLFLSIVGNKVNAEHKVDTQVIKYNHMAPAIMPYHDTKIMKKLHSMTLHTISS